MIQHVDPITFKPKLVQKENGWKFELFIHDILPFVNDKKFGVLIVDRTTEFAPIKN